MEAARTSQGRRQVTDAAKSGVSQEIKTHFRVCRFIIETGNLTLTKCGRSVVT